MTQGQSLGSALWAGWGVREGQGQWPRACTHSGKPWSAPLRKETKGQS